MSKTEIFFSFLFKKWGAEKNEKSQRKIFCFGDGKEERSRGV